MGATKLELVIPPQIWEKLELVEQKAGIPKEDVLMRAVVKVIEEFEVT